MRNPRRSPPGSFLCFSAAIKVRSETQVKQRSAQPPCANWMAREGDSALVLLRAFHATEKTNVGKHDGSKHGPEILQGDAQGPDHDRDAVAPRSVQRAAYRRAFRAQ